MREKRIQLGTLVASTQRIYLDLRFWIMLRDVVLGRSCDTSVSELLTILKDSVSQGKAICPISESVFIELLKQGNDSTRLATAQLIDELSLSVTLIPFDARVCQELCNSFYMLAGATDLIPTEKLVWTKLTYVLGEMHPSNTPFSSEDELAIQKAFSDHMWTTPLAEMVERMGKPASDLNWDPLAADLNEKNHANQSTIPSYAKAFQIEFEGGLSLFRDEMLALIEEVSQRGYADFGAKLAHLSQKKRFEAFAQSIPTLHIYAACHAAVRWDQKRNLTGNDLFDFHHAQAAVGYCDVFLTERSLSTLLSQKHLGLSKYQCQTFWSPSAAVNWLREMGG